VLRYAAQTGMTALCWACMEGNAEAAAFLVAHKADRTLRNQVIRFHRWISAF